MKVDKMKNKGFTLVELAIVMTIIGLLIGGILKGQEMINNARLTSFITGMKSYMAAKVSFQDKYSNLPGDFVLAQNKLPNCTDATFCFNGDGDGAIGDTSTSGFNASQAGINTTPQVETSMFWKHMALAGYITGINVSSDPTAPAWGITHPSSPFVGGLMIGYNREYSGSPNTDETGHFLMVIGDINNNASQGFGRNPLTPKQAWLIDKKLDDGMPNTGSVLTEHVGSRCKFGDANDDQYRLTETAGNCVLWFSID